MIMSSNVKTYQYHESTELKMNNTKDFQSQPEARYPHDRLNLETKTVQSQLKLCVGKMTSEKGLLCLYRITSLAVIT